MINKRILALIFALAMLLLAGCGGGAGPEVPLSETDVVSEADVSETTTTTTTTTTTAPPIGNATEKAPMNDDGTGLFFMGMTADAFKAKVEELGWSWKDVSEDYMLPNHYYRVKIQPDDHSIFFTFNGNDQLININVGAKNMTTEKGLKVGDPESKIKQLHGTPTDYTQDEYGQGYYEYVTNNVTLQIRVFNKEVEQWEIYTGDNSRL